MSEIDRIVTSQTTNTTTTSSSTAGGASASSNDVTIFKGSKKKDLTPEEIKLLKSLGIDPNNTAAVEQWRALPQEQRDAQMNQYYMQAEANKSTAPSTQTQPAQTTPAAPAGVTSANTETQAPASSAAATDTPETTGASSPVAATAASSGTVTPAITSETPQTVVQENADETLQAKTVTQTTAAAQPAAADDAVTTTPTGTDVTKPVISEELAPPPLIEAKPVSLSALAGATDLSDMKIDRMEIIKKIGEEQWESYSEEQRLSLFYEGLKDQFDEKLAGSTNEEKYQFVTELIDDQIKKDRGISDEKWDKFSDKKKLNMRLEYGTSYAIAIQKNYTDEEAKNTTLFQKTQDKIDLYHIIERSVTQKVEEGTLDASVLKKLKESKLARMVEKAEKKGQAAETLAELSSDYKSIIEAQYPAAEGIEQKPDCFSEVEAELGIKFSDIKDKVTERKYIAALKKEINSRLEGKTDEEINAILKEMIFSLDGNAEKADLFIKAIKSNKNRSYYDKYTAVLNEISEMRKSGKLSKDEVDNMNVVQDATVDNIDAKEDSSTSLNNVANSVENSGDTANADKMKGKLTEAGRADKGVFDTFVHSKKPEMRKGLGRWAAKSGDEDFQIHASSELAKVEDGEELTESFNHKNGKVQVKQLEAAIEANPTSVIVNDSLAKATVYVDKKVANEFFDKGFEATKNLLEDDRIDAQKGWADVIDDCEASVQLGMHKTVLTSEYDEVLEYASSNIFKYDESVQADAIKASYNTGNQKAIDAVNAQLDKCSQKAVEAVGSDVISRQTQATESRYTQEVAQQVAEFNQKYQELTGAAAQDNILPDADEQKMAFVQNFLSATPQEQYKLLSKIPQAWQGTVFSKICQYCPTLLTGLVKQGYGKQILKTPGMPSDVIYKVINTMLMCGAKDKKDASKYVLDHKYLFTESTLERCEEILNGVKGRERKNYSSKPIGGGIQAALQPGMSAIYPDKMDMFYKA